MHLSPLSLALVVLDQLIFEIRSIDRAQPPFYDETSSDVRVLALRDLFSPSLPPPPYCSPPLRAGLSPPRAPKLARRRRRDVAAAAAAAHESRKSRLEETRRCRNRSNIRADPPRPSALPLSTRPHRSRAEESGRGGEERGCRAESEKRNNRRACRAHVAP